MVMDSEKLVRLNQCCVKWRGERQFLFLNRNGSISVNHCDFT